MSAREHVYVSIRRPVDGGVSPNAYVAVVTVEIRVYFPPLQRAAALAAFDDAVLEARAKLEATS